MIPFKAKYKDSEIFFGVPTSYNELTLKQLVQLNEWDKKDIIKLIAILCNIDYDVLFNSRMLDIDTQILPLLEWVKEPRNYQQLLVPKQITIDGKQYDVPADIAVKTLGQKISLQLHLAQEQKENKDVIDCIPFALAVYFQPEVTGRDYSEDEAIKLIPAIMNCKMLEAYPVGNFFLTNFIKFLTESNGSLAAKEPTKNFRQALIGWIPSAYLQRLTHSRKEIL